MRARNVQPFASSAEYRVTGKRYHGCHCGVGRIIESPALRDKHSLWDDGKPGKDARPQDSAVHLRNPADRQKMFENQRLSPPQTASAFPPGSSPQRARPTPHTGLDTGPGKTVPGHFRAGKPGPIAAAAPVPPARPERHRGRGRWSSRGSRHPRPLRESYRQSGALHRAETASPS